MNKNERDRCNKYLKEMTIVFLMFSFMIIVMAIVSVSMTEKDTRQEIREVKEQAIKEIQAAQDWVTGEYPQWFIEWQNTDGVR